MGICTLGIAAGCTGTIGDPGSLAGKDQSGGGGNSGVNPTTGERFVLPERELAATVGLRRLGPGERDATLFTLLEHVNPGVGSTPRGGKSSFFDNYGEQELEISETLVRGVATSAKDVAAKFVNDRARRDRIIGCQGTEPGCLEKFVTRFGRLALRHPLSAEDKQTYLDIPKAAQTTDFYKSVELIVSAILQDPEFLHRFEVGTPVEGDPGLLKLTPLELASRLSYLLWGDAPSPDLLDAAQAGGLSRSEDVAAVARKMLTDRRALNPVALFHGQWLGYLGLSHPLAAAMRSETDALLSKVILEDHRPWQDIFRAEETLVTYELAQNYGIPGPAKGAKPKLVSYPSADIARRGILSHGTFLSLGSKFGDTSPTVRGKEIRRRLFCQEIKEPDPKELAKVKADTNRPPPGAGSLCKWDRYKANRDLSASCAACHNRMDLIGFGLENFDALGRPRAEQNWKRGDDGLPGLVAAGTVGAERCRIQGEGSVDDKPFKGPGGLADLLTGSEALSSCALNQLYLFGMGLGQLGTADSQVIERLRKNLGLADFKLDEVLANLVSSPAFAHRREPSLNQGSQP